MCNLFDNKIDTGSACLSHESCFGPVLWLWATHTLLGVLYSVEYCDDSTLIWASIVSMYKAVSFFCRGDIKTGNVTYLRVSRALEKHFVLNSAGENPSSLTVWIYCLHRQPCMGRLPELRSYSGWMSSKARVLERLHTIKLPRLLCVWVFPCGKTCKCACSTKTEGNAWTWWIICRDVRLNTT